jgi:ethanolamine transporter EutH
MSFGSTSNKGPMTMLKNKKTMMILAIVVVGTLFGGILAVSAATNWLSGQQATLHRVHLSTS